MFLFTGRDIFLSGGTGQETPYRAAAGQEDASMWGYGCKRNHWGEKNGGKAQMVLLPFSFLPFGLAIDFQTKMGHGKEKGA